MPLPIHPSTITMDSRGVRVSASIKHPGFRFWDVCFITETPSLFFQITLDASLFLSNIHQKEEVAQAHLGCRLSVLVIMLELGFDVSSYSSHAAHSSSSSPFVEAAAAAVFVGSPLSSASCIALRSLLVRAKTALSNCHAVEKERIWKWWVS